MSGKIKDLTLENYIKYFILVFTFIISSCATHKVQYGKGISNPIPKEESSDKIAHQFFLIGDAGNADEPKSIETLKLLKTRIDKADSASTLLFLGDNIYPNGMPAKLDSEERKQAEIKLQNQIDLQENFKGNLIFIPGNHDWYHGLKGLQEQEKFVKEKLGKKSFLPRNSCGIDHIEFNENLAMIVIDSQWYLENWDNYQKINEECDIKSREDFLEEFESYLNKFQNQTTIVAIHHPMMSNGTHGGQFSLRKQLFPLESNIPLPVLGTLANIIRKTSGISPQDIQNNVYRTLTERIMTILEDRQNVIFVSGHEHNLQYIEKDNIRQIISGSGSKTEAARAIHEKDFSYGGNGYAVLNVYEKGNSIVNYYANENGQEKLLFSHEIISKPEQTQNLTYNPNFSEKIEAQVYTKEMTTKSGIHKFLIGDLYRDYYSNPIQANVLDLTKYKGGVTPVRAGGGHQSKSLRLVDADGKEYVMRAVKKSATRFLQAVAFKDQYVAKDFEDTYTEGFLLDFYTSTNPYYPFTIGELADPLGLYHTNPELYYVPKQNVLQEFNSNYGDELYMLEERPMKKFSDDPIFGKPNDIIGTDELLTNLRSDEKYKVDEKMYIRARLFDMLLGDWDRHSDQWRWGEFEENGSIIYQPIARDRDQVFPKYDGFLLSLIMRIPALRHMQPFTENIRNVKWFNMEPYPMDIAFTKNSTKEDWITEANYINENLTDEIIDNSFQNLPDEIKDENLNKIKELLKIRRPKLKEYAEEYYKVLRKTVLLTGTDKDDKFVITRLPKGETKVQIYRLKKSGEELFFEKNYFKNETKEIWIYGMNDQDKFEVNGNPENPILIRLIGGQDADAYAVENNRKVRIYDFQNKKDNFDDAKNTRKYLSNDYELNNYDYRKPHYNKFTGLPSAGYNPDDGVKLGMNFTYTVNGFDRNPFTRKHSVSANYYFATSGYELTYTGTFAKFIGKWNLELMAGFTSPTFASNFFGYGNETETFEDELGMDYNRVRMQTLRISPSIYKLGRNNTKLTFKTNFENILVSRTEGRITENSSEINPEVFNHQYFGEAGAKFTFKNYDNFSHPTMGMLFEIEGNWKTNLNDTKQNFPYLIGSIGFAHRITRSEVLTFATIFKGKTILNDEFEFHQAANIGGDRDLRAYRSERFSGRHAYSQSSDLRLVIGKTKNTFVPMKYGILLGYDYGRVWMDGENSKKWHQSYGGGIWINGINMLTGRVNYFYGSDGGRISAGLNFGF